MAYIVDFAETYLNGASTALALNMPAHVADDILCVIVTQDASTSITMASAPTAATAIGAQTSNGTSNTGAAWYKKAASSSETFTVTTTDGWIARVFCIRDADPTTPLDAQAWTTQTSTSTPSSGAVTTTTADCLVLYMMCVDGIAVQAHSNPGVMSLGSADNQGTTATTAATMANAWYVQRTAGATPTPAWTASAAGVAVRLTVAFRNKSGGIVPAYIDDVSSPATTLTPGHHFSTLNNISFPAALTATANINGKTTAYVAAAAQADLGINPYSAGLANAAAVKAATVLNGFEIALTGNRNLSTGLIMGSLIGGTPKMGAFGSGNISEGGYVVRIGSGASNWCAYQVGAKDASPNLAQRCVFAIQAGYTGSAYGTPGSAVTTTAVSFIQCLNNTPSFSSNIILSELYQVFTQVVAGGTTAAPVDLGGLVSVGQSFRLPVIEAAGPASVVCYPNVQIGGGDAVNFVIDAGTIQGPRRYNTAKKVINYHANDNVGGGLILAGKAGDKIHLTNSVVTAPTTAIFEIASGATSACDWNLSGTSIINRLTTLRPVMTFTGMSFTDCPSVTLNASTVTNCKFDNAPLIAGSPAAAAAVSNSTITSGGTGHGITITGTAADITLTGLTFSGYAGSNGSTGNEAVYVNIASGTMTINIANGNTPSIRTAGAVVTVSNAVSVSITCLDSATLAPIVNARVRIVTVAGGNVVLSGLTNGSGVLTGSTSFIEAVTGYARRATLTDGALYKSYTISATVTGAGLSLTALMIGD